MAETVKIVLDADDKASKTISGVHGAMSKLGDVAKGLAVGGIAVAGAAVAGLTSVLLDSVQAAMEAQEAQAQLAAVIESTGGAAGVTAQMANDLATSLQNVTRFEDDAVLGAENILLTFTHINKDIFPETVWLAADMSQALGQDMKTSAMQLGKALNDPIQGVGALQRVGVSFTEDQKKLIEELVNSNRTLDAQKLILQELQKEFGGSAKAAGETFAGKLDILQNKIGDVKERIGGALIPALSTLVDEIGPKLIEWADKFAKWIETDGAKAIQDLADWIVQDAVPGVEKLFDAIRKFVNNDSDDFIAVWFNVRKNIEDVQGAFEFFTGLIRDLAKAWSDVSAAIQSAIDKLREWLGMQPSGPAGGGGSGAGGPNAPLYNDPTKGYYHQDNGTRPPTGNSLPMGGYSLPMGNQVVFHMTFNGAANPAAVKGAVLDALSLARARGMAI